MAKGNMFQGMARGKVGDVVFSRNNGEQISRVRNRHPKNPRTNKQMYQRAVMATVMQAYAAGQEIFNHSFQGKSVGAENQRAFLSKNSKLLRGLLASEIEAGTTALNCNVAVVAPGAITPTPNEYMISEGTYPQTFFNWSDDNQGFYLESPEMQETLAQYAQRVGLRVGDIFTFVCFAVSSGTPSFAVNGATILSNVTLQPSMQYPVTFGYVRMQVKDVSGNTTVAGEADFSALFEVTASKNGVNVAPDQNLDGTLSVDTLFGDAIGSLAADGFAALGLIRSRLDEDLRSTSFLKVTMPLAQRATKGMYGITSSYALAAWQQGTEALGDSDLILEGGDEQDFHRA